MSYHGKNMIPMIQITNSINGESGEMCCAIFVEIMKMEHIIVPSEMAQIHFGIHRMTIPHNTFASLPFSYSHKSRMKTTSPDKENLVLPLLAIVYLYWNKRSSPLKGTNHENREYIRIIENIMIHNWIWRAEMF